MTTCSRFRAKKVGTKNQNQNSTSPCLLSICERREKREERREKREERRERKKRVDYRREGRGKGKGKERKEKRGKMVEKRGNEKKKRQ